jgi:ATP/maltotriose-dependent transcriptional regulator MalT
MEKSGNSRFVEPHLLSNVFQNILNRRFADAERSIDEMEAKIKERGYSEFASGFICALRGIVLMYRAGEQDTFISKLDLNNTDMLKKYYREFLEHSKNKLHADYDCGYFSALAEFLRFALKNVDKKREQHN